MGPVSKSAKKSKTPGPVGTKKDKILKRKAFSEGGQATKNKTLVKTGPKSTKSNTSIKPYSMAVDQKKKLAFDEPDDEEQIIKKTPVGIKGKKSKTPKSSGKGNTYEPTTSYVTPKDKGFVPKAVGKKAMSEGGKLKKSKVTQKREPASAGANLKKTKGVKKEELSQVQLPFDVEEDYDEDEDEDFLIDDDSDDSSDSDGSHDSFESGDSDSEEVTFNNSARQKNGAALKIKKMDVGDDEDDEEDEDDVDDDEDEDGDDEEEDMDFGTDDESDSSDSEDTSSFESNDAENVVIFNQSKRETVMTKKTPKSSSKQLTSNAEKDNNKSKTPKTDSKNTKTPKSTAKVSDDTEGIKKSTKTPKSALKMPGTAKSTGKKVSIVVTTPELEKENPKKVVTTPHPSLTKKIRQQANGIASISSGEGDRKTSSKKVKKQSQLKMASSESEADEKPLNKQLSFGDEEEEETGQGVKVKGQAGKRKLEKTSKVSKDEDEGPPKKKGKQDGMYYHCGNLPPDVNKQMLVWFFAEAGVKLGHIHLKKENVARIVKVDQAKSKKKLKKKTKMQHCYATLQCASKEDAKMMDGLNGIEFTAPEGKWRTYELTIYPVSKGPREDVAQDDSCVYIKGLDYKLTDQQLQDFFKGQGVMPKKVSIARRGIRQISKGYGFAWFGSQVDMQKAMKLSSTELQGHMLNITQAKPKQPSSQYQYKIGSNLDMKKKDQNLKKKK